MRSGISISKINDMVSSAGGSNWTLQGEYNSVTNLTVNECNEILFIMFINDITVMPVVISYDAFYTCADIRASESYQITKQINTNKIDNFIGSKLKIYTR